MCVCPTERKRQLVRVEVKSSQNVNDPAVMKEILEKVSHTHIRYHRETHLELFLIYKRMNQQGLHTIAIPLEKANSNIISKSFLLQMEQILKEKGLAQYAELSWRTQSNGNVFQKKDKKSDTTKQTCVSKLLK